MRREPSTPRPNWQRRVEARGLSYHTAADGSAYWDESACFVFTPREIDALEQATDAIQAMCMELVQRVVSEKLYALFLIPPGFDQLVERSWEADEPGVYGRFDLAYDGNGPPKLLEYNADTPTGLLEASVTQWDWLTDLFPEGDQFNSIDDKLVDLAWPEVKRVHGDQTLYGVGDRSSDEDAVTVDYLLDTAHRAGFRVQPLDISQVGYDSRRTLYVGLRAEPINLAFKLYPWEWLVRDPFGVHLPRTPTTKWVEPPWKMILSCKAILPLLWEMFPDSPYLLPASFDPMGGACVRKPLHSREGANITRMVDGREVERTPGPYDEVGAVVYQAEAPLFQSDGNYAVLGSWVIAGHAAGIGVREDRGRITRNTSRFVPHRMG